jgi:hypothetical protein
LLYQDCLGIQYDLLDIKTLKDKALAHLKERGKTLGVGQAEEAEPLYHNIRLYPQMFPGLFPYGHLLMYHDKRFQTDLYFPMVWSFC